MQLTYFKRFRMEIDLRGRPLPEPTLPPGYQFVPWSDELVDDSARTKYLSFRDEMDANVFPCLGELEGCRRLMNEIRRKPGFLPGTTWLLAHRSPRRATRDYCGTVQGIRDRRGLGAIQNVGITPGHRGNGLGSQLLWQSLRGFRHAGIERVYLEVTSNNLAAIRLYHRLGFESIKTVFKAVELAEY
jgi:hypothetical protein